VSLDRAFLVLGSLSGFLAVLFGAFGAHALKSRIGVELLATFETGVRYQMYHALALLAVALVHTRRPAAAVTAAGWLFIAGTVIFCGSLYLLALTGAHSWGAITPMGGLAFLAGWLCLLRAAWMER
jgi:uncharacterized membrane protein YgdD (TMEM256/DUF423 family)